MGREEYREFVAKAESLVKPEDSTAISFLGDFNRYLPLKVQRSLMEKGSRGISYMGFIVDPYCFFLAYPVLDREAAQAMLPEGYELAETSLFKGGEKRPLVIISSFTVRTSVFAGMRVECYLVGRSKRSGRVAWIITDYETNTTSHDPKNGFCGYSCDRAYFATTPFGELLVEAENRKSGNRLSLLADLSGGEARELEESLWVEGNLTVDYGGKLKDPSSAPFGLIFEPFLMREARALPPESVEIRANSLMEGIIDGKRPVEAAFFPYSQHFVIRQDLGGGTVANEEELAGQVRTFLDRKGFRAMKGSDITRPLFRGMIASALVNAAIIGGLVIKILFF